MTADLDQLDTARSIAARGDQAVAMQRQARSVGGCEHPVRVAGKGHRVDTETGEIIGGWSPDELFCAGSSDRFLRSSITCGAATRTIAMNVPSMYGAPVSAPTSDIAPRTAHPATYQMRARRDHMRPSQVDANGFQPLAYGDQYPRGERGRQGLASDAGGCAAGILDGTGHHLGSTWEPRRRFVPRRPANGGELHGDMLLPEVDPRPRQTCARWGEQVDVRPIAATHYVAIEDQLRATDAEQPSGLTRGQIAGYLAKYATKDTEVLARLRPNLDIWRLTTTRMPEHVRRLAVCAWLQARAYRVRDERHLRARRWVHQFGYGGHYLTKSRKYSTTFGRLRQARRDWHLHRQRARREQEADRRADELDQVDAVNRLDAHDHDKRRRRRTS